MVFNEEACETGEGDFQGPETFPSVGFKKKTWKRSLCYRVRRRSCGGGRQGTRRLRRDADAPAAPARGPATPGSPGGRRGGGAAGGRGGARRRRADVTRALTSPAAAASKAGWVAGGAEFD